MYRREAGFELRSQLPAVQLAADQHQLVRPRSLPLALVQGETLRHQVKDVPLVALVDPQQAFGAIDALGKPVEKILKLVDRERPVTLKGQRLKTVGSDVVVRVPMRAA